METKTIFITGSTDGIGKQTAIELAKLGHEIIIHGKNPENGKTTMDEIIKLSSNNKIHYFNADLSDFNQIKNLCENIKQKYSKLDVLLNNAGIFPKKKVLLPNNLESTFMINHMSHFTITNLLLDLLKQANKFRIVNVSSMAQSSSIDFDNLNGEKHFDVYRAYAVSKLENVLFTYKLHRILSDSYHTVNCLHPGIINTKLLKLGWGIGGLDVEQGTKCMVYVALSKEIDNISGRYFSSNLQRKSIAISYDKKVQDKLWEISENIMFQYL